MNQNSRFQSLLILACGVALGGMAMTGAYRSVLPTAVAAAPPDKGLDLTALQTEVSRLKGLVPDQSHAMADVGYHFANVWFAGQRQNWPLAKFYLDETRSHLKWAVRIIPVRKTKAGDLDLGGILEGIDNSLLSELGASIEAKDGARFEAGYRKTLEGCYSCHQAAEKPYLRPQVPLVPPQPIMNTDPDAKWPN